MTGGFTDPWLAPAPERGDRTFALASAAGGDADADLRGDVGVEGPPS
jgi:hypothetical protein